MFLVDKFGNPVEDAGSLCLAVYSNQTDITSDKSWKPGHGIPYVCLLAPPSHFSGWAAAMGCLVSGYYPLTPWPMK